MSDQSVVSAERLTIPAARHAVVLLPLLVFVVLAAVFAWGLTANPSHLPSALVGRNIPNFELSPIQGRQLGLSSANLVGEVSLVNVFASWCTACRVAIDWGVCGVPETYVVGQMGRVAYRHVGPVTTEAWRQTILPLVKNLRNETRDGK